MVPTSPSVRPALVRVAVPLTTLAPPEVLPKEALLVARPIRVATPTGTVLSLLQLPVRVPLLRHTVTLTQARLGASTVLTTPGPAT